MAESNEGRGAVYRRAGWESLLISAVMAVIMAVMIGTGIAELAILAFFPFVGMLAAAADAGERFTIGNNLNKQG